MEDGSWVGGYTATATDSLGQVSPPAMAPAITVDTVPPTVSMEDLPAFQNQTNWTLRWTGSDPDPGTGVHSYDLQRLVGGSAYNLLVGVSQTEEAYQAAGEGAYTFQVRARDHAQNLSAWDVITTTVDQTAPGLGLTLTAQPPHAYANGNTVYYGQGSGVFTLIAVATDTLAGLFSLAFPEATGAGATLRLRSPVPAPQVQTGQARCAAPSLQPALTPMPSIPATPSAAL